MAGVAMTGTENMVQRALETTNLASDLEITGPDGKSLLSLALQKNQDDDAVDLLIAHWPAAVLDKAYAEGRSPLSYAVQRVTSQATRALLEAGVNTNTVDRYGTTPLSYAAQRGHPDTVCLLLAADETLINIPGHDDSTPLIQAGRRLNIPVMSVLLEVPDINILPLKGRGHSFLCHLMVSHSLSESKYRSKDESEDGLERELDGVIDRIHHLFRLHVLAVRASMHSPFICAIGQYNYPSFRRVMSAYRPGTADWDNYVEDRRMAFVAFMSKLQRFAILSNYFHPGLDFSQCITTTGILELLGESNYGEDYDNRDYQRLCLRALQLYVNET
ncbi:hypothetical protein THARTR1_09055 [Trichoderma harzianum]|uniref:Uncharacterized protein n=1 Tax=Trichoderma harzianum TaxID=5544 RepID=A0A2K0TXJ9_TRIHA|nr:hypothetical protein THARTR1_09055 [Trichoderma harzianum]